MPVYFKGPWPEEKTPEGEPDWFFYEVDEDRDVVTRTVEVFSGGTAVRNSIALEARHGTVPRAETGRAQASGVQDP